MTDTLLPEVKEHFSRRLGQYSKSESRNLQYSKTLKPKRVLEAGCGANYAFDTAAEKYGVDITPNLLRHLKLRYPKINLVMADSRCLPFRNKVFDVTGAAFLLHHLVGETTTISEDNIRKSLDEMARTLTDEGQMVILEHLCRNRLLSLIFFYLTRIFTKLNLSFEYFQVHDKVVLFFLDIGTFERSIKRMGLTSNVFSCQLWQFRKVKLGYDIQFWIMKR